MARGAMEWTTAMLEFLEDGEWHALDEVIKVGAAVVPAERALEEMGKTNRAQTQDEERRIAAGQWTVAQQALMGRRRFGQVEYSGPRSAQKVRKAAESSVSIGILAERVRVLEEQMSLLLVDATPVDVVSSEGDE